MPTVDDLSAAQKHLIRTAAARLQDKFKGIFGPERSSATSTTASTGSSRTPRS